MTIRRGTKGSRKSLDIKGEQGVWVASVEVIELKLRVHGVLGEAPPTDTPYTSNCPLFVYGPRVGGFREVTYTKK